MTQKYVDSALPRTVTPDQPLSAEFAEHEAHWLLDELRVEDSICHPRWPRLLTDEPQAGQTGHATKHRRQRGHGRSGRAEHSGRVRSHPLPPLQCTAVVSASTRRMMKESYATSQSNRAAARWQRVAQSDIEGTGEKRMGALRGAAVRRGSWVASTDSTGRAAAAAGTSSDRRRFSQVRLLTMGLL